MKKFISLGTVLTIALATTACGGSESDLYKVGMTTDSGTIDDKSFNQGSWEGITKYEEENGTIEIRYVQPTGEAEEDYLASYANLVDAGYQTIISPGYKFETAIHKAQAEYPDVNFVILDGYPHAGDFAPDIAPNTESIFFAEHESGFYAGIVSAITSETGKVSYIGGMEIPAVQRFGWGYVSGVAYANAMFGTDVEVSDYIYQGTFTDSAAGKALASTFYDNGSDIVFVAAGGVGVGVIDEGKTRLTDGEDVWVVGVDVDQYDAGIISEGSSVILTSAMKDLSRATYDAIDEILKGEFKGGQSITLDSSNGGVGLPAENPNLSAEAIGAYEEAFSSVVAGDVVVPSSVETLETFLSEYGYETPAGVAY